jgi:hypothetical protein
MGPGLRRGTGAFEARILRAQCCGGINICFTRSRDAAKRKDDGSRGDAENAEGSGLRPPHPFFIKRSKKEDCALLHAIHLCVLHASARTKIFAPSRLRAN